MGGDWKQSPLFYDKYTQQREVFEMFNKLKSSIKSATDSAKNLGNKAKDSVKSATKKATDGTKSIGKKVSGLNPFKK